MVGSSPITVEPASNPPAANSAVLRLPLLRRSRARVTMDRPSLSPEAGNARHDVAAGR
jgi:hypothetical protein